MPATKRNRVVTRPPHPASGPARALEIAASPGALAGVLEDAAHYPGGYALGLARPRDEAAVSALLSAHVQVLPVGSQSSLTGGATPMGELVLSLERFDATLSIGANGVHVGAGVVLERLQGWLASNGRYYPPVPSYSGAQLGGAVATNAAGPATFKYGATRDWVRGLTVVLASGEVLDLERGQCLADPDFVIETRTGRLRVPVPTYQMPAVAKRSAGYWAAPGMDLIDLFIGAEGTLGVITEVVIDVVSPAPFVCVALIACRSETQALELTGELRQAAFKSRSGAEGLEVSAIEYLDVRSLELLREDGRAARSGVALPLETTAVLLVQLELPPAALHRARDDLASALEPDRSEAPALVRFARLLDAAGVYRTSELALPDDPQRAAVLLSLREAVPDAVNAKVARLKSALNAPITKVGADMIVPFAQLPQMVELFRDAFSARGLDHAIWGHASDGNLHPNVIPTSLADVQAGKEAILACGRAVIELGGCPLAEHGVGRNPVKQRLLEQLYDRAGIEQMRAVKRSLDPTWKLAPGNVFTQYAPTRENRDL